MAKMQNQRKRPRRRSLIEQMEARLPLASDVGHNFLLPGDVNDDRAVSAGDALAIINLLAEQTRETRSAPEGEAVDASLRSMFYDVNDDGQASASDALRVINELARESESHDLVEWFQGDDGARAKVELHVTGTVHAELEVRLTGAPANGSFDVRVDGQVLGQIHTDEVGRGKLELEYGGEHPPIPDVLVTATSETPFAIGDLLSGTIGSLGDFQGSDGGEDADSGAKDDDHVDAMSDVSPDDNSGSSSAETDASTDVSPDDSRVAVASDSNDDDDDDGADENHDQVDDSMSGSRSKGGADGGTDGGIDGPSGNGSGSSIDGGSNGDSDGGSDGTSDGDSVRSAN